MKMETAVLTQEPFHYHILLPSSAPIYKYYPNIHSRTASVGILYAWIITTEWVLLRNMEHPRSYSLYLLAHELSTSGISTRTSLQETVEQHHCSWTYIILNNYLSMNVKYLCTYLNHCSPAFCHCYLSDICGVKLTVSVLPDISINFYWQISLLW
jgi:hypothetical protein